MTSPTQSNVGYIRITQNVRVTATPNIHEYLNRICGQNVSDVHHLMILHNARVHTMQDTQNAFGSC